MASAFWTRLGRIHPLGRTEVLQLSALSSEILATPISIFRSIIVLRLLGPHEYGLIGLAGAVGGIFWILQHAGLGVGAAREAAHMQTSRRLILLAKVVLIVRFVLLLPLLAFLVFVAAPASADIYRQPSLLLLVRVYALQLLVISPGEILAYILTGAGQYRTYFVLRIFKECMMTVGVVAMIRAVGTEGYFVGLAIAGLFHSFGCALAIWRTAASASREPGTFESRPLIRSVIRTSLAIYSSKILRGLSFQAPILIGGLFLSTATLGWLGFAQKVGGYLSGVLSPISLVTLSRMSHLGTAYGPETLRAHFSANFRWVAWGVGLALVPAIVLSREIAFMIGGYEFSGAWKLVQLMFIFYACVILADNIFTGVHFPLSRERDFVLANLGLFLSTYVAAFIALHLAGSALSVVFGMLLGGGILLSMAIWQTRGSPRVFGALLQGTQNVVETSLVGLTSGLVPSLAGRLVIGAFGVLIIGSRILSVRRSPMYD